MLFLLYHIQVIIISAITTTAPNRDTVSGFDGFETSFYGKSLLHGYNIIFSVSSRSKGFFFLREDQRALLQYYRLLLHYFYDTQYYRCIIVCNIICGRRSWKNNKNSRQLIRCGLFIYFFLVRTP